MSTRDKFYNIFWQNKSCQNTFLLSKNELLDSIDLSHLGSSFSYTTNKIIISNSEHEHETKEVIKLRTENYSVDLEASIDERIIYFEPLIIKFLKSKYEKQVNRFINDIQKRPQKLTPFIFDLFNEDSDKKQLIVDILKQYRFVPPNIQSFDQLQKHFEDMIIPSKKNSLINEWNIKVFSDGLRFVKELYVNHNYKRLYESNQILVNSLVESDNFKDRIDMFHRLYEARILLPSIDDGISECHNCDPLTYRASIQLRLNPKKLQNLTCPSCSMPLTYFVPYVLNQEIFQIVQSQDGLIMDAACYLLEKRNIDYKLNEKRLNNIEIDCIFNNNDKLFLIEAKMYELRIGSRKLNSKLKLHFSNLSKRIKRLKVTNEFADHNIKPVLLVNIENEALLINIENELKSNHPDDISQSISILNIDQFKNMLITK